VFQDGSDRLPTDSPPTPSATPRHPPAAAPRLAGTGDSPRRSVDAAEAGLEAGRESLPRSADGPTLPGSITPPPKRRPPSPGASDRRQTGRGAPRAESAPAADRVDDAAAAARHADDAVAYTRRRVESDARTLRSSPFASRRFHVLLNSLFKVLFNFPSRYLCAIGLVSVFSLRWSLPPALGCNLKQPDSEDDPGGPAGRRRGLTPALGEAPIRRTRTPDRSPWAVPNTTVPVARQGEGFGAGLIPLHSPLLRESSLVSFPPLINMLKFSG
jgi:hypothetical protein